MIFLEQNSETVIYHLPQKQLTFAPRQRRRLASGHGQLENEMGS